MSIAFSNLLKYIDQLPHTQKKQVYQWVKRYVEPSSSLIYEMREARFQDGFEFPVVHQNTFSFEQWWINRFKGVATKYLDNFLA